MGDVLSLVEQVEQKVDKAKAEKLARKMSTGRGFDLGTHRCLADHALCPTAPGPDQKVLLVRLIFQDLDIGNAEAARDLTRRIAEQLLELRTFRGAPPERDDIGLLRLHLQFFLGNAGRPRITSRRGAGGLRIDGMLRGLTGQLKARTQRAAAARCRALRAPREDGPGSP